MGETIKSAGKTQNARHPRHLPGVGKTYRELGSVWALVDTQKEEKQGVLEISDEEPCANMSETRPSKEALEKAAS